MNIKIIPIQRTTLFEALLVKFRSRKIAAKLFYVLHHHPEGHIFYWVIYKRNVEFDDY